MQPVALVTGAGKGIGLEMCKQLIRRGFRVFACPRRSGSEGLASLLAAHSDALTIVPMDVADAISVAGAVKKISDATDRLDVLINNGAIYPEAGDTLEGLDLEGVVEGLRVNTIGPLRVAQAFLPLLRNGREKRIVQITSLMGSIAENGSGGSYAYRISKAALNMANRTLAHDLAGEGFFTLVIHPGWVRTRMGGERAPLGIEEATEQVLKNALETDRSESGGFKGPGGKTLPW